MKNYKFKINGKDFDVSIADSDSNIVNVNVNGKDYKVELSEENIKSPPKSKPKARPATTKKTESAPAPKASGGSPSSNLNSITAPLPGNILEINVKKGDTVSIGQVVLVMEAMKMENNVSSEFDGVVSDIKVNTGQSVMQNDVLIELE